MRWGCHNWQHTQPREDPGTAAFLVLLRTKYDAHRDWYCYRHEFVVTANSEADAIERLLLDMKATIEHIRQSAPPEALEEKAWLVDVGGLRTRKWKDDGTYSEFDKATERMREWITVIESKDPNQGKVIVEKLNGCYSVAYFEDYLAIRSGIISGMRGE